MRTAKQPTQPQSNIEKLTAALLLAGFCIAPKTVNGVRLPLVIIQQGSA